MMPTSALTPASSSLHAHLDRLAEAESSRPGTLAVERRSIVAISSSRRAPWSTRSRGFRMTKTSVWSTPIGSVAISGLPVRLTTRADLGEARSSAFSTGVVLATALVERDARQPGDLTTSVALVEPGDELGARAASTSDAAPTQQRRAAMPIAGTGCRTDRSSSGA